MTKIESSDYHDYVIKNGKLIGEFEQMYENSATIPWHQDEQENWIDVLLTIAFLKSKKAFFRMVDYGSGTGHYLDILIRNLDAQEGIGFDVSATATRKAKELFPELNFRTANLMIKDEKQFLLNPIFQSTLHVIRGTLWYVFPKMETVVENIYTQVGPNDSLLVVQNFPPLNSSFVGKEVIPNPKILIQHFVAKGFDLESHIWYEQHKENSNDSWFIGLFKKEK
ncbi:MAG TPA: class I SAM-dependent methyltransferase [Sphingobacteriaceae bacterium]